MTEEARIAAVLVTTTVDSEAAATTIANAAVGERLAACVQVGSPVTSIYRWQGEVQSAREWVLQLKTSEERLQALMRRIRELHPYQVPEILASPVVAGDPAYLAWLADQVTPAD